MFGEFRALSSRSHLPYITHPASFAAVLLGSTIGLESGTIFVDTNVMLQYNILIASILGLEAVATLLSFLRRSSAGLILSSALILLYGYMFLFSLPYYRISIFLLLALVLGIWGFSSEFHLKSRNGVWLISFSVALTMMMLLSGLIRIQPPQNLGLLVASISDDVQSGGIPVIFLGGLVFFTRYLVFSISAQAMLMFVILAVLLVDNYFLIIDFFRKNSRDVLGGQISGALTVLSCQCESITAAFPSIVSLVLSAAILPLIGESIFLVFMTNLLLRYRFKKGISVGFLERLYPMRKQTFLLAVSSAVILMLPLLEVFGVYFGWQRTLYFYGGLNFLMFISGILASFLVGRLATIRAGSLGRSLSVTFVALSTIFMFVWFYPPLADLSVTNGSYFALMSLTSFAGGITSGLVYLRLTGPGRRLFLEYLGMMFTMFAIVIFYISILTAYSVWPVFNLTEQVIFSIAVWVVSLPFMWFTTNIALNHSVSSRGVPTSESA